MTKADSPNQTKASNKRELSPTDEPYSSTVTPKKPKFLEIGETAHEAKEIIEQKQHVITPTAGNIDETPDHKLDTNLESHIPQWALNLLSTMNDIREEITAVRTDLLVLQSRIPRRLDYCQWKPPCPQPEAMETEQTELDSVLLNQEKPDCQPLEELYTTETQPPHADYLDVCFINRIGLSPRSKQKVNITSFDGVIVAKGYNRIVPTWQGYFIEVEKDDLVTTYLEPNEFPADGEKSWLCPGLKVFSLTRPDNRRSPRAHRFALKTSPEFTDRCNPLRLDKYYIHAYQARFLVEAQSRSLNSRKMALALNDKWPDLYHPRRKDITNRTDAHEPYERGLPIKQNRRPTIQHPVQPTPFVPLANLPPVSMMPFQAPYPHNHSIPNHALQPNHLPLSGNQPQPVICNVPPAPPPQPAHYQMPPLTYAQAANPLYSTTVKPNLPPPIQYDQNKQWYLNNGNINERQEQRFRAPPRS